MQLDSNFPGGNIIIGMDGDAVRLRQDWSTSSEWWFYWAFRVRGAAGSRVRFQFTDRDVFTARGPCLSLDRRAWRYLGRDAVQDNGFEYAFAPDENEVFFAFCPAYVEEHLHEFLAARPQVQQGVLCSSEGGRAAPHLTLEAARGEFCVLLTARLHACETLANFVLEGALDFWLSDAHEGAFLRERVDVHAVPFFDKDGVEAGEQGKNRAPHDHNRDFSEAPLYASTRALMAQAPGWRGQPALFLDLHCPWIRGGRNEEIFLLGVPQPWERERERFSTILQGCQRGPLVYDARHTIACGEDWNSGTAPTSARWAREHWKARLGTTLEMPYAVAGGQTVTPDNARQFGCDLGRAIAQFLQEL